MQDAYPEATPTGTVFLSAFTTKLAVYALARGYAGTEELVWVGTVMAVFPIFYAVLENDLRRVLAYTLNNQLGFMVAGIGVGTTLAINGAVAHAFVGILYKALLFMSLGAVIHRVGTAKGSELGGLYKSMPLTTVFCLVGCASISAFLSWVHYEIYDYYSRGEGRISSILRFAAFCFRLRVPLRRHKNSALCLLWPGLRQTLSGSPDKYAPGDGHSIIHVYWHWRLPGRSLFAFTISRGLRALHDVARGNNTPTFGALCSSFFGCSTIRPLSVCTTLHHA